MDGTFIIYFRFLFDKLILFIYIMCMKIKKIICAYCGKEFEGKNKYCSLYCKNEATIEYSTSYRKKHLEKYYKYKKICNICKKEYCTNSEKREWCSTECRVIYRRSKILQKGF